MTPAQEVTVGLDAGHLLRDEVEHLLGRAVQLCGPVVLACTHVVDGHWAGSLRLRGPAPEAAGLSRQLDAAVTVLTDEGSATVGPAAWAVDSATAARELSTGTAGRAVLFEGQERLVGEIDTDTVTGLSAVTAVVGIAGTPTAGTRLVTRNLVRPVFYEGSLVLQVRPFGVDGALAPFEVPNPTPCCAEHG